MDPSLQEDIKQAAKTVFLPNLVTARTIITGLRDSINNPETPVNTVAVLHRNLEVTMRQFDAVRMTQHNNKLAQLNILFMKYPDIDKAQIQTCFEVALSELDK